MSTTSATSFVTASFLNLFGIFICVALCLLFLILGGHSLKYIKEFAVKIKIIANRAEDKNMQLKDFNYKPRETILNNPTYLKWESIFKNEIKRSRSLQYFNILGAYLSKYDHLIHYPFRDRTLEKYDLLKPKTTFYTWLVILSCCISWMTTIFLSAILTNVYSVIDTIPLLVYILVTLGVALISSFLNIICINRLMRIYVLNVKGAFKIDYGHRFDNINSGLKDYEPENSIEEEEFLRATKRIQEEQQQEDFQNLQNPDNNNLGLTYRTNYREDTQNLNSTRKLLNDNFEKSDNRNSLRAMHGPPTVIIEEVKEDEFEHGSIPRIINNSVYSSNGTMIRKKGKPIKDVFDLQVPIDGVNDADENEKYIFIEDRHAIGDMDLLNNEAMKGENSSNITTFVILFLVISCASAICCYLNYQFPSLLAQYVFYMFIGAWVGDLIVTRVIILAIMALFKLCKGKIKGYKKIKYQSTKEVRSLLNNAIKEMLGKKKDVTADRISHRKYNSQDSNLSKNKGYDSIGENNFTMGGLDRHETSAKNPLNNDFEQDQFSRNMSQKKDNDQDGNKVSVNEDPFNTFGNLQGLLRPQLEMAQKNPEQNHETTQANAVHTQIPLLQNLARAIQEKEDKEHENLMDKKQLINELVDYNLLLMRKIFDAYEQRADKVLGNFRSDKTSVIRKRYMVPIINPNYDYERFLEEMKLKGKAKDEEEENSVHLDGETVCEDYEKQLMEAIIQEASDDLIQKIEREKIDKFGNVVDKEALKNGISKAIPQPDFGLIEHEAEENIEEDDEQGRKKSIYDDLKNRLANGEELTEEELAMLEKLENERIMQIDERLMELMKQGFENLSDEEKLEFYDLNIEKLDIEQSQIHRKKSLTDGDHQRLAQIQKQRKRFDYERLKILKKLNRLSSEEEKRLQQLEEEFSNDELQDLLSKLNNGTITEEELRRLMEVLKQTGTQLTDEEQSKMRSMMSKYGMLSQEEMDNDLMQQLLQKLRDGSITQEELESLMRLMKQYGFQLNADEEQLLNDKRKEFNMLSQEEIDNDMMQQLLQKLRDGTITSDELERLMRLMNQYGLQLNEDEEKLLQDKRKEFNLLTQEEMENEELSRLLRKLQDGTLTEEELKRLLELMQKNGMEPSEGQLQMLYDLRKKYNMLTGEEKELEELEELRRKLLNGDITEDELRRLMELQNKYGVQLRDDEIDLIREAEDRMNEIEHSRHTEKEENFSELPPVVVMNKTDSPKNLMKEASPEKREEALQENQEQDKAEDNSYISQKSVEFVQSPDIQSPNTKASPEKMASPQNQSYKDIGSPQNERNIASSHSNRNVVSSHSHRSYHETHTSIHKNNQENVFEQDNLQNIQEQHVENSEFNELENQDNMFGQQQNMQNQFQDHMNQDQQQMQQQLSDVKQMQRVDSDATPRGSIHSQDLDEFNVMQATGEENFMKVPAKYEEFGRDDLDQNLEEGSIYSHETTTILDEEKVSFMHIEHLPNQGDGSEDSFEEQDMVYYNKDDLTNYSKNLGLNKVKAKQPIQSPNKSNKGSSSKLRQQQQQPSGRQNQNAKYYSENDLAEVQESEVSENEKSRLSGRSRGYTRARSTMSLDSEAERQRQQMSRGQINHNQLNPDDNYDLIDGRVKVDSWNLNYNKKKKKLKNKKITNDQKRKMQDLQDIYGIDAKTLAGLSKGRLPRQLIASGKLGKGGKGGDGENSSTYQTENEFRSTQNTFVNKQGSTANKMMKESVNDAQSNMFSFNGYGTSKRWNEIQSTLKGANMRDSKLENISEFNNGKYGKKVPLKNKLTTTQQQFNKANQNNNYMDEESKSQTSESRNNSLKRPIQSSTQLGRNSSQEHGFGMQSATGAGKGSKKKKTGKSGKNAGKQRQNKNEIGNQDQSRGVQKRNSQSSLGMDSHAESDEAVDDKGAMFQKRNYPFNNKKQTNNGMNDDIGDHSESDEGINDNNPNFSGNEFVFKKRAPAEESNSRVNNQRKAGIQDSNKRGQSNSQANRNQRSGGRIGSESSGRLQMEDLEALNVGGRRGTKNTNKKSAKQLIGKRVDSAERDDSEEENLGGQVNFQKQNRREDYDEENSLIMKDNSKPPSGAKNQRRSTTNLNGMGNISDFENDSLGKLNNIYGDPYNISGNIHPGVKRQLRNTQQSDKSDNERNMRGSKYNPMTENEGNELVQKQTKQKPSKKGNKNTTKGRNNNNTGTVQNQYNSHQNNRSIDDDYLEGPNGKKKYGRRRSEGESDEEDGNDFIVGPESNHSMIKQRDYGLGGRQSQSNDDDEDDRYLLIQRERQIMEDLENNKNENSRLAKKRKVRKAAHSQNPKDAQARQFEELQKKRLMARKREAEAALFAGNDDDIEKGQAKMKKKKIKKDFVKKEINYWLDYDSPYAEYLVARFREWSPAPNNRVNINQLTYQAGSSVSSHRKGTNSKIRQVQKVYDANSRQGSSKQNSRSPDKVHPMNNTQQNSRSQLQKSNSQSANVTQQKFGEKKQKPSHQQQQQQNSNFLQASNSNTGMNNMFVDDYEEP